MSDSQQISAAVAKLYDTYPFPPEPLLDEPPPGYNWRWNWLTAYAFCTGQKPPREDVRILDAGCGTGVGTEYLVHLNPEAAVTGIDLSAGALAVAKERCQKSGATRAEFHHLSLFDAEQLAGEFDLINCVGVLHHTPDPVGGIQALAKKLAPGGLLHVFVYGELGRWEIKLMQEAIALLQGDRQGDYTDGVAIGRQIFANLPENNRLRQREQERWSLENQRDECFADMYVHPQEIDYNINTVFDLIDASGLEFVGLSNPQAWDLSRLVGSAPELMERAQGLSDRERYRLIELLDPGNVTHYEFFLARPPLLKQTWQDDATLLKAIPEPSPCLESWQHSPQFFNQDYQLVTLEQAPWEFLVASGKAAGQQTVEDILATVDCTLDDVRSLQRQQYLLLTPG
ncbi:bifunctional 2-polyprenyl-6-hydroxyphenol methylase/3-demethylubiquinol 3-O-methyltransferase UbiG [Halomicronema sp. CCY15110]|uniref:class I SAM-dependent methyltransferase n=1 Tax=Halomicronema sp. CCY15110 TaxID=2767773 RepID=UPI00194F449A|nr:class I SAM-dependent methyltransferase [Halomicronema sp. CCY15110]